MSINVIKNYDFPPIFIKFAIKTMRKTYLFEVMTSNTLTYNK